MEIFNDSVKFFISVISILNPIGAIPIFMGLTRYYSQEDVSRIATNCAFAVFVTLFLSGLLGDEVLKFFGIQLASFRVGGGILIAFMALSMLRGEKTDIKISQDEIERQAQIREIGIVPLAIPMLAGPGSISNVIIQADYFITFYHWVGAVICLALIAIILKLILTFSRTIRDKIGQIAINVSTRIFGLILMAVAIEHITKGIKVIFNL